MPRCIPCRLWSVNDLNRSTTDSGQSTDSSCRISPGRLSLRCRRSLSNISRLNNRVYCRRRINFCFESLSGALKGSPAGSFCCSLPPPSLWQSSPERFAWESAVAPTPNNSVVSFLWPLERLQFRFVVGCRTSVVSHYLSGMAMWFVSFCFYLQDFPANWRNNRLATLNSTLDFCEQIAVSCGCSRRVKGLKRLTFSSSPHRSTRNDLRLQFASPEPSLRQWLRVKADLCKYIRREKSFIKEFLSRLMDEWHL